jgi:hypothetical protein
LTWEEACEKEKEFIQLYGRRDLGLGTLVNMTDGGDGVHNLSDETKKKLSEIRKGLLSGERNGRYGMPVSEETRKKISDALTGKPLSEETRKKISQALKGRKISEENKLKISQCHKGKIVSEATKEKQSNSYKQLFIDSPELKDEMRQRERLRNSGKGIRERYKKFHVNIRIDNGVRLELGSYKTYEEALEVRLKAEDKYWGTSHYPPLPPNNEPV